MATVARALEHVKQHLHTLVPRQQILSMCRALGHRWRDRQLGPAITVELFLLQLLAGVALTGLRHVAGVCVSAQAICAAKMRLPLGVMMKLVEVSAGVDRPDPCWKGLCPYLADGMSCMTQDTPELARRYGKSRNQRGASQGYPAIKLLALMDLTAGLIRKVIALPWARQEFTCLARLFDAVGPKGLLLGDRGLVSFAHLALLMQRGIAGCFRLPRGRVTFGRGKGSRRRIRSLGRQDHLVRWTASRCPGWLSARRWAALAGRELVLRQIGFRVTRKGFRTQWAWIVTTLTDPAGYPAQDLIDLYSQRWQIEVYFRDLKQTLGLRLTSARTVEGTRKEILAFVLLYNLVRRVMLQAARNQSVDPDRISFIDAIRWLLWSPPGMPLPPLVVNQKRIRPAPPRRIKNARRRFGQLNQPRAALTKPPYEAKL